MKNSVSDSPSRIIRLVKSQIIAINIGFLGFFLFFSEFINALFNNLLDEQGADLFQRIVFAFKPTVVGLFFVFSFVLISLIFSYLRPLFFWLKTGQGYEKARTSALRVPWAILLFQIIAWTIGTTTYYAMYGFQAESGIPYVFGLFLKLSVGLIAGMYSAITINLVLIPTKKKLEIVDVRSGERDGFTRVQDYFVVCSTAFYIAITMAYLAYYYARSGVVELGAQFYGPLFSFILMSMLIAFGLISLSRKQFTLQVRSIAQVVQDLALETTDPDKRIHILIFNELGEIAGNVNRILDNFRSLITDIHSTSSSIADSTGRLSSVTQQNAAYAAEQAAASAEVVSTMEDVDKLSKDVGKKIDNVAEQSVAVKENVQDGFSIIRQNIEQMNQVKASYDQTIEGMKNLSEHISGIWEIVKIINGIAGQIKIIAFNAALEASSAGEAGKNFEIVASEIRRLADNTVDSTKEIKMRIGEIEEASDRLIHFSESDSQKIHQAWELSHTIQSLFQNILSSSEVSAGSAEEIQGSINKQVNAFEQILITLRQISEGIGDFTTSIDENSTTADTLNQTVRVLNGIVQRFTNSEEDGV